MTQPSLTISSLDLDRLEDLLEQVDPREFPAARQLETELARADVVDPQDMPAGVVTMNSRVRFADAAGATREFQLCYPKDMTGSPDQLSVLAPVGAALLGLSAGQAIDWPLPDGGHTRLTVLDVVWQPEAAGELHR
ncbi:nucleoside diphosphate kinase regulator [Laribacter hongkongensis]|uniref:Transcription elongation factor n=2 Tax=Laribacter hongkongensis TaxID=168471 RepID=C1DA61_LARHH|nr:nucleoside diphosphate kinase regulator [Laribacter hongkongensis]ACO75176.1 Transcription elongation factor [Laribacter hongkongensis HLHK9]ASJ25091.1 transcription elongation factor [Laribacter hongkongensis]MBE5530171.1 transcription elongation factor GreAB [Laribacter hongkongensis]MCG8992051.1 nucleoside diphosphate kinase regulator [Laribacter hongkongensis]MCG8995772.1 nucleoside diphosphate kinase regulator [Laribacter hongkongensis]